jgi:putative membrane protein
MRFLVRVVITAIALGVATIVVSGITVHGGSVVRNALTLLAVAVIFGLVNAILKPLIHLLGCGLYILTLGLIAFIVNALLFALTSSLAGRLDLPFHVDGFRAAFWGAIVVGVVSWLISLVVPDPRPSRRS